MKRIVLFKGGIETQGYFSEQLAKAFIEMGHKVLMFDFEREAESSGELLRFIERGNTVMITFNFHAISQDTILMDENHEYIWEAFDIPCYNIVVDHPFYYHGFLEQVPPNYYHISIDRKHRDYMKRFFPEIHSDYFLPLAGTPVCSYEDLIPWEKKRSDFCFTGNYTPPDHFDKYIDRNGQEYGDFYRGMIGELLQNPNLTLEDVAERHIRREIPEVTEAELKQTIPNLIFIDLYVRNVMRGKIIQTLVDGGFKVEVYGGGWDELVCNRKENLLWGGPLNSQECLEKIMASRISVNVMPWFKDGAHDRIFNTMLNGAVCLTDSSLYLEEILKDEINVLLYNPSHMEVVPEKVGRLLEEPGQKTLQNIREQAYHTALKDHTWASRARVLEQWIEGKIEK